MGKRKKVTFRDNGPTFALLSTSASSVEVRTLTWLDLGAKRTLDIIVSLVALVILIPAVIIAICCIYFEDRGAIFFTQTRVGENGKAFIFPKFRSMCVDAEQKKAGLIGQNQAGDVIFKISNDPRITNTGRFLRRYSIDEIPQLWLVLIGTLSIVGPRPHLPEEVEAYSEVQLLRLSAKPGLVCLREVYGRSKLTFNEWIQLDLHYLQNRSFWLDCWILLRVVPAVLKSDGAY